MSDNVSMTIEKSNPFARRIIHLIIVAFGFFIAIWLLDLPPLIITILTILIPIMLVFIINLSFKLFILGSEELPIGIFILVALFIAGGITIDGLATVIQSPDLVRETNILARILIFNWNSTKLVIAYGVIVQSLIAFSLIALWAGFLKHRLIIIRSAINSNPQSGLDFFKAATGGAHLTWRQYLIPLRITDLPEAYHFVWFLSIGAVALVIDRWFLGLGWLGYIIFDRASVYGVALLLAFLGYYLWLANHFRKRRAA
jgi:hypothetical protein